jgi:putative ABC transport system permease protein
VGITFGLLLAFSSNLWLVKEFGIPSLPAGYPLAGAALILALGQLAAVWPALRASAIAPTLATRSA